MTRGHLRKRSLSLGGHRTSVALEPAFWDALAALAGGSGVTLAALVERLDAERDPSTPLASVLRLAVLRAAVGRGETRADAPPVKPP